MENETINVLEKREVVLNALKMFEISKPFRVGELVEMCDTSTMNKGLIAKSLPVWTNPDFSTPENDRIRKVLHRVPGMGTGWYAKISDKYPRKIVYPDKDNNKDSNKDNNKSYSPRRYNKKQTLRQITRYYFLGIRVWEVVRYNK